MLNQKLLTLTFSLLLFQSAPTFSKDCIKVKGAIHTSIQDPNDDSAPTLGTLSFNMKRDKKICGIRGHITGINDMGLAELEHFIACDDHSTFRTIDSVTKFRPKNACEVKVEEISTLIPGPGDYEDYEGRLVTKGILNLCTGKNDFKYKGRLCYVKD